jgi:DNA repair exonuclease SbcCD nuclease subunit
MPTILCGHFLLSGVRGGMCIREDEDVPIESGDLPTYAYVALGHIHRPQKVRGENVRYCGSIERFDQGERDDAKEVVLVELDGGRTNVRTLPLDATPFARIEASSEEELEGRRAELLEPERTLVSVRLNVGHDQNTRALLAAAHRLFPRLYQRPELNFTDAAAVASPALTFVRLDAFATVRAYLSETLAEDPDGPAIIELAEGLLAEEEMSGGAS